MEMNRHGFDGDHVQLLELDSDTEIQIISKDSHGADVDFDDWWVRHHAAGKSIT